MKKRLTKKFKKEWVELTLCDMMDEIIFNMKIKAGWREETMKTIKKYSAEIYNTQ